MPQAFFAVGHNNWGKSRTLRALTGGLHRIRNFPLDNRPFQIRRSSNDDELQRWTRLLDGLNPTSHTHVILTVCPTPASQPVLARLRQRGYGLFFWIIRHNWQTTDRSLTVKRPCCKLAPLRFLREGGRRCPCCRDPAIHH